MALLPRCLLLGISALALLTTPVLAQTAKPAAEKSQESVFPPWQHGENNDAIDRGLEFTVPEADDLADFHGDLDAPKLVLFVGGNYFFAMAPLVRAFEADHPEFKGRIYWETLPPGLLAKQIEAGGRITVGNMTWTAKPDAYLAGLMKVRGMIEQGLLVGPAVSYVTNDVAIPAADNATAIYAGAEVKGAPHPDAAKAWLDFIRSPQALQIFERYGFKPAGSH
jgi:molybdate transport system substrate-binding protein